MRVSNRQIMDTMTKNLFRNEKRLLELQNKISSGKRINRPSDDPLGMKRVLDYRKLLAQIKQYKKNIAYGETWLKDTESVLGSVSDLLRRAKEIAVYQATGTSTAQTREIAAQEVKNLYDQIIQLANSKWKGNFIFAGYQTKTNLPPFSRDEDYNATYQGDTGKIEVIVGEGNKVTINLHGQEVFSQEVDIFLTLKELKESLENNDPEMIGSLVEEIDKAFNQIDRYRAEVGARINRLESAENYWNNFNLNIEKALSDTEDADLTEVMTDLLSQQAVYQASLATTARIIQPSLIDFLR
ncbi:MAG: flagellar hook-associated protein 3 [Deltaproteobacteria bacterium]|nr:MAG: flagellar hook-associated protein 3 [Deltaproteobacteria bacterium]